MKKINGRFVTAIIWILVAILFFYVNKIGVGLCWLLVGIINLISAIKTHQMNKKIRAVSKHLEETRINAVDFLKKEIEDTNNLNELILVFEKMCEIPIQEEKEKEILFETGTYSFTGKPMFHFSLVRQYPNEEEEYYQIHMDIIFEPTEENRPFQQTTWNFELEENIFDYVRKSQEYKVMKDALIAKIDVYMDET